MRLPRLTKPYKLKNYKFSLVLLVFALSVIGSYGCRQCEGIGSEQTDFWCCVGVTAYDYCIVD